MNVKRYTADTMTEAMNMIRDELGRDAFILSQRTVRRKGLKGLFQKPQVEVVAAYEPDAPKPAPPSPSAASKNLLPPLRPSRVTPYNPERKTANASGGGMSDGVDAAGRAMELLERISNGAQLGASAPLSGYHSAGVQTGGVGGAYKPSLRPVIPQTQIQPPEKPVFDDDFQPFVPPEYRPEEHVVAKSTKDGSEHKLASLENKIDMLSDSLNSLAGKLKHSHDERSYSPEVSELLYGLRDNEVHEEFVQKIAREVNDIVLRQKEDAGDVMEQILRQYIGQSEPIRMKRYKRTVVMLVGPTGVGKTTTLAKLAAVYTLNHHAKVGVITTDTFRIAAVEQLKTYTQIMEIPLSIVYEPTEIADALKEHEDKDIVLIDTTGRSPNDRTQEEEINKLIRSSECDEVHLVMSSTTSFTGILNILGAYSFLKDFKIIMTKLDETPTWGAVLNTRFLTDKPLSYTTSGQNVPDDIEVADTRTIVGRLMTRDQ